MRKFHILSSVALAFSLFFTLGSTAMQAQNGSEFAGGNGTEKNPWQIATKQQLAALDNYAGEGSQGKYFILTQDLDFTDDFSRSGAFYNDGKFWKPLCGNYQGFCGTLDGGNHEIIGLRVNSDGGLFAKIDNATIKNLTVSYGKVKGNFHFGGITLYSVSSTIENCHVRGGIYDDLTVHRDSGGLICEYWNDWYNGTEVFCRVIGSSFVGSIKGTGGGNAEGNGFGGLIGHDRLLFTGALLVIIEDSFVEADITKDDIGDRYNKVGGLLGRGQAKIQNCYVKGNINVNDDGGYVGGLVGHNYGATTIEESYFQGNITGRNVGGLVGMSVVDFRRYHTHVEITSSYVEGEFRGRCAVGGLIGIDYSDSGLGDRSNISESYSKGRIEIIDGEKGDYEVLTVAAGGLVGFSWCIDIEDCYSHCNISVSAQYPVSAGGLIGGICYDTYNGDVDVQRSYSMGAIEVEQWPDSIVHGVRHAYLGGLAALPWIKADNGEIYHNSASIKKCVAMNPSLTAPHGDIEDTGRIGVFDTSDLSNNYALNTMKIKIDGQDVSVTGTASDKNGQAKTAAELAQQSTYTGLGWNFSRIWKMSVNGYPIFMWEEDIPLVTAPSITSQPKSQTVNEGSSVTFSVTATGTDPLSYQWYKGSSKISEATSSSYKISSVKSSDAGSYTVIVSNSAGSVTSSTATLTVNASFAYHPADTNKDKMIKITEVTAYGKAWKNGETWSVAPNPIPISYVTRAGALWKNGEVYTQDKSKEPPLCWENVTAVAAASASAYCTISGEKVTITVTPDSGVSVYAAEDMIPSGWTVTGINENGVFDSTNRKVKWGPWFDNSPRTLTYTLVVPSGFSGTATLSGTASFDGVDMVITGDRQYGKSSSSNQAVSKISGNQVTITVTPGSGVSVYAAEDKIPSGLTVTGINESGVFDTANRKVKWGPWFDNSPRTLTYTLVPGSFTGTATLSGTASFDGVDVAITGDRQYTVSSAVKPTITTQPKSQTVNEGDSVTFTVVADDGSKGSSDADFSIPLSNNVNLDMVWIEPGTFIMGSPDSELGKGHSEALRQVTLTKGYWIGKYEVTQTQYTAIMGNNPTQDYGIGDNYPVHYVSWYDATDFCSKLTKIENAAGRLPAGYKYTLPTEAQWEYACRAGTTTALNSGKNLSNEFKCSEMDEVGWYQYNSSNTTHPVGQKKPNNWGLYDMHGNVMELCLDGYGGSSMSSIDPVGDIGDICIIRGGDWMCPAGNCRSATMGDDHTDAPWVYGFRVALVPVQAQASAAADTLTYQWYKDGVAISGATGSSYTIKSVKLSDAGKYTVKVSNSAGFVTSDPAILTVNGGSTNPNGTAVRSVARNGKSATVTLKLEPDAGVSVMFVEEHVPSGVTISVNNGGTYIASRNMIRWSFLDGMAREISYVLTVANSFDGKVSLSGEVTFDETTVVVTGTSEIDFAIKTHPADMNDDFEISTKEIASYALAWTKAQSWTREPYDIPVTYVARAAIIWVNGGYYTYDPSKAEPSCWVSTNVKPASVELAADSINVRTINVLEGKADVILEVIPADGISVYFVEEQLPVGMNLNVTNISDGGKYVEGRGLIRWSFLDAEPRTLTYTIEPEAGFDGVITVNGEVTFDEETQATSGDTEANFGGSPIINYVVDGKTLILNFTGTLYESEDTVTWTEVEGAESPFIVDTTKGKKFYRSVK